MKRIIQIIRIFFSILRKNKFIYPEDCLICNGGYKKDMYLNLFKNSSVGLYQTTPAGKILSANPALINMLEFDSVESIQKRDLSKGSYVDPNKRELFKEILERDGEIINFESEWYTKSGKILYVREGARAIKDHTGEIVRYDGAVENITDLILIQQELTKAKNEAEEANRLKSAFLANMSHEIRTPMNSILGFSELLEEPDLSEYQQRKFFSIIRESGERMLNTINEIMDISKIEAGCCELHLEKIDIDHLLRSIFELFKSEAENKGLEFSFKQELSERDFLILSDEEKLRSIITNLIQNAIKYTDKGSVLLICSKSDAKIEIKVEDTGIGIEKHKQAMIFEYFTRAAEDSDLVCDGSGLGLSIAKSYAKMIGGHIGVDSVFGVGSRFFLSLPI